jgi:hypothetical protein
MREADVVLANTETARESLQSRYPALAPKVHYLPNGFDPDEDWTGFPANGGILPRIVSHVGRIYGGRTPQLVLESIERLLAARRLEANQLRLQLIGPVVDEVFRELAVVRTALADGWLWFEAGYHRHRFTPIPRLATPVRGERALRR